MSEEIKNAKENEDLEWAKSEYEKGLVRFPCNLHNRFYGAKNAVFQLQYTDTGYELWIGKMDVLPAELSYAPNEKYVMLTPKFGDSKIVFDRSAKKVNVINCDPSELFLNSLVYNSLDLSPAVRFLVLVASESCPYVYRILTSSSFVLNLAKKRINDHLSPDLILGMLRNICNLACIEKLSSTTSYDVLVESLRKDSFVFAEGKKLRQSVQLPVEVLKWAKTQQYGELIPVLQEICNGDDTVANKLVSYLKAVKTRISSYARHDLSIYLSKLKTLVVDYKLPVLKTVNYLAAQNLRFARDNRFGLPIGEAGELVDTVRMTKEHGAKFEFSSNLSLQHRTLVANCNILKKSRAEEFKNAVAKYDALRFSTDSDEYVITVPESEQALFEEGNVLHHCVASYRDLIIDQGAIVLFLRKKSEPETPFVTIEVDNNMNLIQVKERYDQDVLDSEIFKFIGKWKQAKGYLLASGKKIGA